MSQFETVQRIFSDILEIPPARITPESTPDELEQWDSIRHMNILLAIEGELGIEFSAAEIEQMVDMPHILAVLATKTT